MKKHSEPTLASIYIDDFRSPTAERFEHEMGASLEALRTRCTECIAKDSTVTAGLKDIGLKLCVALDFMGVVIGLWSWATSAPNPSFILGFVLVLFATLVASGVFAAMQLNDGIAAHVILEKTAPLGASDLCVEALHLVEQSEAARSYRDSVVGQGRALLVVDYEVMTTLAGAERVKNERQAQEQACKQLHGLESPAAVP